MPILARFTRETFDKLTLELDSLKQKRNEVRLDVKETREQGDLRENFAYHAAREQQGILEARIVALESRLNGAEIVEAGEKMDEVMLGIPIQVQMSTSDKPRTYVIVSPEEMEGDPPLHAASSESVIGQALMGKKAGDKVEVEGPNGAVQIEVLSIGE